MHGLYKVYEKTRMILYLGKVFLQWQKDLTFPKGPQLLHILGKAKGFFQAFYHHAWPTLLRVPNVASSITGLLELRVKGGLQVEGLGCCFPLEPLKDPNGALFFCCALDVWASLAGAYWEEWVIYPSSATLKPLPPWPHFLFLSAASPKDAHIGAGVGGWGTTRMTGKAPSTRAVSNAKKSGVFFLSTIPSWILVSSWLVLIWMGSKRRWEVLGRSLGSSC